MRHKKITKTECAYCGKQIEILTYHIGLAAHDSAGNIEYDVNKRCKGSYFPVLENLNVIKMREIRNND